MDPLYRRLASLVDARKRCFEPGRTIGEWVDRHTETITSLVKEHLPSGAGFDSGTTLDLDASSGEVLVFHTAFHHMTDAGYDGWTEHRVTVRPSLAHGFVVSIGGRDRNEIKSYIGDCFHEALSTEIAR